MKRTYASRYKVNNVSSQRHYTRFRALQEHTESKIKAARIKYTTARDALLSLRGPGDWEKTLCELRPEDIRGLSEQALVAEEQEELRQTQTLARLGPDIDGISERQRDDLPAMTLNPYLALGEGHRTLSWIWYGTTVEEVSDSQTEACKSYFGSYL